MNPESCCKHQKLGPSRWLQLGTRLVCEGVRGEGETRQEAEGRSLGAERMEHCPPWASEGPRSLQVFWDPPAFPASKYPAPVFLPSLFSMRERHWKGTHQFAEFPAGELDARGSELSSTLESPGELLKNICRIVPLQTNYFHPAGREWGSV